MYINIFEFNDNELLYLIKEQSEEALDILFKKYGILISKKIKDFDLLREYEDIFQECLMVLYISINKFDDRLFCFYSFFEKNLTNKLISIKNKIVRTPLYYVDDIEILKENPVTLPEELPDERMFDGLTNKEKLVINLYCLKKRPVKEISQEYGMKEQEIYYILRKAKEKILNNIGQDASI